MSSENIQMVDVKSQYLKIKEEIDQGIQDVINSCQFINGPKVKEFQASLESYLDVKRVVPVANGTDALQIALMALNLKPGDEVIVPAFTYVATAEVIGLLNLKPIMVDVDPNTFNLTAAIFEKAITEKTKAVVPVHLFGQCAEMEGIMKIANAKGIFVIEDNAQAIGSDYIFSNGKNQKSGTIGHIGCTSFYPSKNLGCYGDGGAIFTNDEALGEKIRMIANHGQSKRYYHDLIGCNSRLDSIQAVVLNEKLKHLDAYNIARQKVAQNYDNAFSSLENVEIPYRDKSSSHVFHQYTLKVKQNKRDELKSFLADKNIPSMIYYPVPLYEQKAFSAFANSVELPVTHALCQEVISLPIHTEMMKETQDYIIDHVRQFFNA